MANKKISQLQEIDALVGEHIAIQDQGAFKKLDLGKFAFEDPTHAVDRVFELFKKYKRVAIVPFKNP